MTRVVLSKDPRAQVEGPLTLAKVRCFNSDRVPQTLYINAAAPVACTDIAASWCVEAIS